MKEKIKIVQFVEALGGGVYTYVRDLCNFLALESEEKNLSIHLIYSPNRMEFDRTVFREEINPRVDLHELDMQREIGIKDFKNLYQLRKILLDIRPHILHLHSSKAGVLGRIAAKGLVTDRNIYYSPHGYAFEQKNILTFKKYFYKGIEIVMPRLLGGTTVAAGETEYSVAKSISKAVLVRNGVDLKLPEKYYRQPSNKKLKVGSIGRLSPQKNPAAFNEIAKRLPDVDFLWIGDGELRADLASENITITGWIKKSDVLMSLLAGIDVYLQVSLWEGLPIAVIEAMAMRKPLIVSNVVGNKDCVDHGWNGFVFDNIDEAVKSICILQDEQRRIIFGQRSYQKAMEDYDNYKNFTSLLGLYLNGKI